MFFAPCFPRSRGLFASIVRSLHLITKAINTPFFPPRKNNYAFTCTIQILYLSLQCYNKREAIHTAEHRSLLKTIRFGLFLCPQIDILAVAIPYIQNSPTGEVTFVIAAESVAAFSVSPPHTDCGKRYNKRAICNQHQPSAQRSGRSRSRIGQAKSAISFHSGLMASQLLSHVYAVSVSRIRKSATLICSS